MVAFTVDFLRDFFDHSRKQFCVAYSGGIDSCVLLHGMHQWQLQNPDLQLRAVHINHGISVHANDWEAHCRETCLALGVPFQVVSLKISAKRGESLEAVAREARYEAFHQILAQEEYLLTAHTLDDQMETVFLQLLRGAGLLGLSAMPLKKKFSAGYLIRPLLSISRQALQQYALEKQLQWICDDSNQNVNFNRNYLRHLVIPTLKERWPSMAITVARSAEHCAQAMGLLDDLADSDLTRIESEGTLSISDLLALSLARQSNVLRRFLGLAGYQMPSTDQLADIQKKLQRATTKTSKLFAGKGFEIWRYRDRLYLMLPSPKKVMVAIPWDFRRPLFLPANRGVLRASLQTEQGIQSAIDLASVSVRFKIASEKFRPMGRRTRSLKKWFQDWHIAPWDRPFVPLIYVEERLAAVVGYGVSQEFATKPGESGWVVTYQRM